MITVNVWPRLGTTVTLESGYVITAAGANALLTPEIFGLLASGRLLAFDPTFVNPNPSPIPPINTGGGVTAVSAAALRLLVGSSQGEIATLRGYRTDNDGGGGEFYWDAGSSTPDDEGMCFGAGAGGRWKRLWDGVTLHADWFGCVHNGVTDDYPLLFKALNYSSNAYAVQLGPGRYAIGQKLVIPMEKTLQGVAGVGGGLNIYSSGFSSSINYSGPNSDLASSAVLDVRGAARISRLCVTIDVGKHLNAGITFSYEPNTTTCNFDDVEIDCATGGGFSEQGYFNYGYTIGVGATTQCDNIEWNRGTINNPRKAAVAIYGGQGFNLVMNHVRLNNFLATNINNAFGYSGALAAACHGSVFERIYQNQGWSSLTVNGGEIEFFGTLLKNFNGITSYVRINNVEWEGCRRIWYNANTGQKTWIPVAITGGRFDLDPVHTEHTVYEADGTTVEIASTDRDLIFDRVGANFNLNGCNIGTGSITPLSAAWKFNLTWHSIFSAVGCTFPNLDVVLRSDAATHTVSSGGTYITGCGGFTDDSVGLPGSIIAPYPDRYGCENADGYFTVTGTNTTATVTLPISEYGRDAFDSGEAAPRFQIQIFPGTASTTCAAGAFKARVVPPFFAAGYARTSQFNVVLDAAPGVGESITYSYHLTLNRQGLYD